MKLKNIWGLIFLTAMVLIFSQPLMAKERPIVLKYSRWSPAASQPAKIDQKWANYLEARSNGRLVMKCFFDGSLAKMRENYRAAQTGISDISYYVIGTNPGLTELNKVFALPFFGAKNKQVATAAYKELLESMPELQAEFKGLKTFAPRMMPAYQMHFTDKVVRGPEDIKGLKIIADTVWNQTFENYDASPIKLMVGDWYMSLERNLVQGHFVHYPVIYAYRTIDLLHHHVDFGEVGAVINSEILLFNERKWNRIPEDLQKIFVDSLEFRTSEQEKGDQWQIDMAIKRVKENDHEYHLATEEEVAKWRKAVEPAHKKWIEDNADRGPSQEIYDKAITAVEKYNKAI